MRDGPERPSAVRHAIVVRYANIGYVYRVALAECHFRYTRHASGTIQVRADRSSDLSAIQAAACTRPGGGRSFHARDLRRFDHPSSPSWTSTLSVRSKIAFTISMGGYQLYNSIYINNVISAISTSEFQAKSSPEPGPERWGQSAHDTELRIGQDRSCQHHPGLIRPRTRWVAIPGGATLIAPLLAVEPTRHGHGKPDLPHV